MHEILIISGKGGTGKTSLTAAFARLARRPIICDLDVDAPDLHLLLNPKPQQTEMFWSGREARILQENCDACGDCFQRCQFGAIKKSGQRFWVDPLRCEGCGVCKHFCPVGAIAFEQKLCGEWYRSHTDLGPMVHAQLGPAQENSGRMVTLLREQAKRLADMERFDLILSDGPPGIGCPVISSLANVTLAIVVTEPTPSGRHDLERVAELCRHFKVPAGIVVNKWDLNPAQTAKIEALAPQQKLQRFGRINFDPAFTDAMVQRQSIGAYQPRGLGKQVAALWDRILAAALKAHQPEAVR
ncbi:MAG: ATP-binding protein [Desulfosarcinaceae bacterium]|nr:ATP-binding protein [Desulfosarcinaceae bacterium]